uniref:UBC core domain-containing protein n=1 Tax=Arcella intermedia TaxID=1963864 RepID=A0A6B2LMQ9_9EUKA
MKRLQKEYGDLQKEKIEWAEITLAGGSNLFEWNCKIQGPPESPYEKGVFLVNFKMPPEYPFKQPVVKFETPIWHPNVDDKGTLCQQVFGTWSPQLKIENVLGMVRQVMIEPSLASPLNVEAGELYSKNKSEFIKKAQAHTAQHAKK